MLLRIFSAQARRLAADRKGSVLPIVGVSMLVLLGAVGVAIDGSRLVLMHSSLQRATDAGALSAVSKLETTVLNDEVRKFTNVNFSEGYVGATITALSASATTDKKTITVDATAETPTVFMHLFGFEMLSTSVTSVVERAVGGLELALVLDNTGSMSNDISSLKLAAKSLLNILYGDQTEVENLYIGLVPFSQSVNIGTGHADWLADGALEEKDWKTTTWAGCVEARDDGDDTSDAPPDAHAFQPYYWRDEGDNDWVNNSGAARTGLGSSLGPNKNCPAELTRLTPTKSRLVAAVDAMKAVGNTHINYGAVWGWRLLSPNWRGLWGEDMETHNLPLDYGTRSMKKAAVIMTDGENTMTDRAYTAYGDLEEERLGSDRSERAEQELDERLTEVCTAMKNAGIVVYTISFRNPGDEIEELMQSCATQPEFYFNSPNAAQLQAAFQQIGGSLSNLRVSR